MSDVKLVDDMYEIEINIAYSGKVLETGMMEVRDFAPSIEAIAVMYQKTFSVKNEINDTSIKISSNVKKGSFIVRLLITAGILIAPEQAELLMKVILLIKETKGRPLKLVNEKGKSYLKDQENQTEIEVEFLVGALYVQNYRLFKKFAKPIIDNVADAIQLGDVDITKSDLELMDSPEEEAREEKVKEFREEVEVITPHLDGNMKKWEFASNKLGKFVADVEVKQYINDVKNKGISFTSGDKLKVKIEKRKKIKHDKETTYFVVVEIEDYVLKGSTQSELPL